MNTPKEEEKEFNILDYDISNLPEDQKGQIINIVAEHCATELMKVFYAAKLKTHIEITVKNQGTTDEFKLSFTKIR